MKRNCPSCGHPLEPVPGRPALRARDLHAAAVAAVDPNESIHYRDLMHRLEAKGYEIAGKDPAASLLAVLGRAPEFAAHGGRSGIYQRAPRATS